MLSRTFFEFESMKEVLRQLLTTGLFYLIITVPLTHAMNVIDVRTGRRRLTALQSGLKEVEEVLKSPRARWPHNP